MDWTNAAGILQEAAFEPENLPQAFEQVSRALSVHAFYLIRLDSPQPEFVLPHFMLETAQAYQDDEWWQVDDRTQRSVALSQRRGGVVCDHEAVPSDVRRRSMIYNEFYNRERIDYCAGWLTPLSGQQWGFALLRDEMRGAFSRQEVEALTRLAPHANRAVELALRIRGVKTKSLAEGMAERGRGAIILDQDARCSFIDPACEAMFDTHFGATDGRLWARDAAADAGLRAIARAIADPCEDRPAPKVVVPRGEARRPLVLTPSPVRGHGLDTLPGARMLVSVVDLAAVHQPDGDLLAQLFNLSLSEKRIALRLANGESAEDIAEGLQLRVSTVRQATKSILAKTDTHRQSQLAALLAKLPSLDAP